MMITKMKDKINETIYVIRNFSQSPTESLGFLIPLVTFLISVVSAIVGYILFIVRDGYIQQISYISELGIDGITQGFTSGTSGILIGGNIPKIVGILSLLQYVVVLIVYFKSVEKTKRIIMIIDLVMTVLTLVFSIAYFEGIVAFAYTASKNTLTGICIALVIILFTVFTFLVVKSESKEMFMKLVLCLLFHFVFMPLLMLLAENIIPLVAGVVVLVIFGLILLFIASAFAEGGSEAVASNRSIKANSPQKESAKTNEKRIEITDYGRIGGINLYRRHGTLSDYIELDNHLVTKSLCSIAEIKSGKCRLYDKASGREIRLEDIPWKN